MYVQTKFIPATNTRGARVKATLSSPLVSADVSVTIPYDGTLPSYQMHSKAFHAVLVKDGKPESDWLSVHTKDGFIFVPEWATHIKHTKSGAA